MVDRIQDREHLDDLLSEPSAAAVQALAKHPGDVIILGVAGKMGPTLARMALRASERCGIGRRIIGVARFCNPNEETRLKSWGIETIRADLLDPAQLSALPDAPNVVSLVVVKFGATGQEALTWATNCWLPGMICQKYRGSRIVALSTGNVYGLCPAGRGGSVESDALMPVGDYAMSCVGRERVYEHFSRMYDIPVSIVRLNYACELRYGVLVDVARRVWAGQPVDLTMGYFNAIWQSDANAMALAALGHPSNPPFVVNVAGPERLSVRAVAEEFGRLFNRAVVFQGSESADAVLSDGTKGHALFGNPRVSAEQLVRWIADWISRGGALWNKPTHFEVRDGKF